ncbi:MAG: aminodeoxychorismate synthase component I [Lachnospiraceae bacterium]|nr:aminodeoxychorismate synthase component I [Lachnospiraceae bacterium]
MSNRRILELPSYLPAAQAFRRLAGSIKCAFLDSSLANDLGRYSILGMLPYLKLVKNANEFFVNDRPETKLSFEDYLRRYLAEHVDQNETDLPLVSGAIGYFSYDYGRKLQGVPSTQSAYAKIPDAVLTFYDVFLIEDAREQKTYLIANGMTRPADTCLEDLRSLLLKNYPLDQLAVTPSGRKSAAADGNFNDASFPLTVTPNFEKEDYKRTIDRMIQYIIEGDIYIANMTQRLSIACEKQPLDLFLSLRDSNPSPFGAYLDYEDFQIVCASPERFLQMKNGHVQTRPIKGTRKRGETPEEDLCMRRELENSEKDKSELLMIVDLERNDLNRVCRPGSVKVTELFTVEEYATVFHLVSNIEGDLLPDKTVVDLLEAAFPGGSITGAPKYRAMEIIDELEHGQRGLYTGSIGYLTLDNCCDFNIVIRTALHQDGVCHLGVGGGITAESELEFEYEETLQKAKALLDAMEQ